MGLFDNLFGRQQDTIQPGAPQITQAATQTAEQQDFLRSLLGNLQGVSVAGGRVQPFQGDLSAGPSTLEQQLFGNVQQLAGDQGPFQSGLSALQGQLADFDPTSVQNLFQSSVVAPSQRRFEEEIIPGIREGFAGTGNSGALNRALANAGADLEIGRQDTLSQLLFQGEQSQLNRQGNALNAALGLPLQAGQQVGATQRGIEQSGLDRILNEFIRGQGIDPLLGLAPTALGTQGFENIVQVPTTTFGPSGASQISQLLQGAGGLATGAGIFRRSFT